MENGVDTIDSFKFALELNYFFLIAIDYGNDNVLDAKQYQLVTFH